ncbi:hypothetical protein GH825_30155 [Bacillus thuringiensis]|nr:hypothetical protein [Bacillus thuringiensis]
MSLTAGGEVAANAEVVRVHVGALMDTVRNAELRAPTSTTAGPSARRTTVTSQAIT